MTGSTLIWGSACVLGLIALWWVVKIGFGHLAPPAYSGRALLKKFLKQRGVDTSLIPDAAIDEIVGVSLKGSQAMARAAQMTTNPSFQKDKNWRTNFVRQLEAQATIIQVALQPGGQLSSPGTARETLVKFGVIRD